MDNEKQTPEHARLVVMASTGISLAVMFLSLVACSVDSAPRPDDEQMVRAHKWYLGNHYVPSCGAPIRAEEILVVDLEVSDYDVESLEHTVGEFKQLTDRPVAVSGKGSREDIEQRVLRLAAGKGCDVVLLGPIHTQTEIHGGDGMTAGGAGQKLEVSYQLFRMGIRTG